MDKIEAKILELIQRYSVWIKENNLEDDTYNYLYYIKNVEKVEEILDNIDD